MQSTPVATANNNAYLTPNTPVAQKQEQRDVADKYSDKEEKNPRHNNKKRVNKPKEQREQVQHDNAPSHQVHEEIVQVSRQEQRQEQRQDSRENKRPTRRQHTEQQNTETQPEQSAVPRRDRNNQQRPNRPNRHRDQSVLNETTPQQAIAAAPVTHAVQQPKVEVIDTPRQEVMPTALVVNVDQAKSEIIALSPTSVAPAEAPVAKSAPIVVAEERKAPVVVEKPVVAKEEKPLATPEKQESHKPRVTDKRASNDPRMRRRQKREAQAKQAQAPKLNPSQVPTLGQYTVGSLIRHVYGEDCSVLIEQFGLIPTFNRALVKFTEQYAATIVHQNVDAEVVQPVTRDVAVTKAAPEAEPAPVLDLTPPTAVSDNRVANDPRERRRLAKQAAEQALEQAKLAHSQSEATKEVTEAAPVEQAVETTPVAEKETVIEAPSVETPELVMPEVIVSEVIAEPIKETVKLTPAEKKSARAESAKLEANQDVQALAKPKADTDDAPETDDDEDKPIRPRRPRGRPPKKITPANES